MYGKSFHVWEQAVSVQICRTDRPQARAFIQDSLTHGADIIVELAWARPSLQDLVGHVDLCDASRS